MAVPFICQLLALVGRNWMWDTICDINSSPHQVEIPIANDTGSFACESSIGTLHHIQSLIFHDDKNASERIGDIVITPDGKQMLSVTEDAELVSLELEGITHSKSKIEKISRRGIITASGKVMSQEECSSWGLATDGIYKGGFEGEFYVTCANEPKKNDSNKCITLRLTAGTVTNTAFESHRESCKTNPATTAVLKLRGQNSDLNGLLLTTFDEPIILRLISRPILLVQWINTTSSSEGGFFVSANDNFQLVSMSQFNNGDVMMLFKKRDAAEGDRKIRIGYANASALSHSIRTSSMLEPTIILELSEYGGYNIADERGLAIQEDPKTDHSFVYIIGNKYNHKTEKLDMQLTKYAWTPIRTPETTTPTPEDSRPSFLDTLGGGLVHP